MKKTLSVLLLMTILLSFFMQSCAANENAQNLQGYAYNLYTYDGQGYFDCTADIQSSGAIQLAFSFDDQQYDLTYTENSNGEYESQFTVNDADYYSILQYEDNVFSGIIRDVTTVVSPETYQFGFIIAPENLIEDYIQDLNDAVQDLTESQQSESLSDK